MAGGSFNILKNIYMVIIVNVILGKTRYIGRIYSKCDMCNKSTGNHAYKYDLLLKELYPKGYKTRLTLCENCTKRETGKKNWSRVKRKT